MNQLAVFNSMLAQEIAASKPSTWIVELESGTWRSWTKVESICRIFSAVELAMCQAEDEEGNWPWTANEITIRVRKE